MYAARVKILLRFALPLALVLSACGPTAATCEFSTCQGCCAADGACVARRA